MKHREVVEVVAVRLEKRFVRLVDGILKVLYEHTEADKAYWWLDLIKLPRKHGVRRHAGDFVVSFMFRGVILKCDRRGFCKVDKDEVKEELARCEEILASWPRKSKHARLGGGCWGWHVGWS
jgi:hypothetical protein